jgi:hypothetical protein
MWQQAMMGLPSRFLRFVRKPRDQALAAPQLHVIPVNELARFPDRVHVVSGCDELHARELPAGANKIDAIVGHGRSLFQRNSIQAQAT